MSPMVVLVCAELMVGIMSVPWPITTVRTLGQHPLSPGQHPPLRIALTKPPA